MKLFKVYMKGIMIMPVYVMIMILVCSCSKSETVQEDMAIGFGAYLPGNMPQTKLAADATSFETTDQMGVYGYLVKDGDVLYSPAYISNCALKHETGNIWDFDPDKYWPNIGYEAMNFYAYWPYSSSNPASGTPGLSVIGRDNTYPYFTYKSDIAGGAKNENFLVGQHSCWRETVDMEFKRPLAKVIIVVTYEDFIGTLGVDFTMPVISSGRFDYDPSGTEDGDGWDLTGATTENLNFKRTKQINGDSSSEYTLGTCYLIPQDIWKFSIKWNYHKESVIKDSSAEAEGVFKLVAGGSHTLKIHITKDNVIEVETSEGKDQWYTVRNENDLTK